MLNWLNNFLCFDYGRDVNLSIKTNGFWGKNKGILYMISLRNIKAD